MFEPFQKFINKAAQNYGVSKEMKAAAVCQHFRALIPEIFTTVENPEKYIAPAYYKNSTLVIAVENSAWSQEIITRKEKIIDEMNKKAGKEVIKNLRTELRK